MPDARSEFDRHLTTVQEYAGLNLSESDTRAYLVDPLLRLLGFADGKHLRREVTVPATKEFLDYELLVDGQPEVIVEAKAVRHSLSDRHAAQCVQYASVLGVRWCLITNGLAWALYDAHGPARGRSRFLSARAVAEDDGVEGPPPPANASPYRVRRCHEISWDGHRVPDERR